MLDVQLRTPVQDSRADWNQKVPAIFHTKKSKGPKKFLQKALF
jgi:hypothetical protein